MYIHPLQTALTNVITAVDVPPILGRPTELIVVNILVKIITNAIDFYPRLTFVRNNHYNGKAIIVPYFSHDNYHNNVGF